jgi:molecular chaperone IbpA
MANVMTLTAPLLRQTVGFDRLNDLFESLLTEKSAGFENYPPYNIEKTGEHDYRIVMAVAGFSMDELSITLENGELTVAATKHEAAEEQKEYLHRGIATRNFSRVFRLADTIKVVDAEMKDGLLEIILEREIPEEKKPRTIAIKGQSAVIENKKK